MKIVKTVLIIWLVLLGVLIALFLFKDASKSKLYKKFMKLIEDEDDNNNKR
jgi:uncharacterized membrane protein